MAETLRHNHNEAEHARAYGYADIFFRLGDEPLLPPASEDWGYHAVRATAEGRLPPPRLVELDVEAIEQTTEYKAMKSRMQLPDILWTTEQRWRRQEAEPPQHLVTGHTSH